MTFADRARAAMGPFAYSDDPNQQEAMAVLAQAADRIEALHAELLALACAAEDYRVASEIDDDCDSSIESALVHAIARAYASRREANTSQNLIQNKRNGVSNE